MRYELSDHEWSVIRAMLPRKSRGKPRVDDRRVLNGIFWVLRSGAPWRDLPAVYGPRTTCYNRFVRWRRAGVWESIMRALTVAQYAAVQMIDTSMVRVHQHAACIADSTEQAVGRSRGGLTSKLHVVVDGKGLPLRLGITAGQPTITGLLNAVERTYTSDDGARRSRLRCRLDQGTCQRARSVGQHSTEAESSAVHLLQSLPLPRAKSDRAVLQQDQTLSTHRNSLRQARSELPRVRSAGINPPLAPRFMSARP